MPDYNMQRLCTIVISIAHNRNSYIFFEINRNIN